MNNLTPNSVISRVAAGQSAGTGTTNASEVSMVGFHAVTFLVNLSTVVAGGSATLSIEGRDESGGAWTALEGSVTRTSSGILALEVERPMFAEVRAVMVRADENVTTDPIIAIRTRATDVPTNDDGQTTAVLVSPDAAA